MTPRPLLFCEDFREDLRNKIHREFNALAAAVNVTQDPQRTHAGATSAPGIALTNR